MATPSPSAAAALNDRKPRSKSWPHGSGAGRPLPTNQAGQRTRLLSPSINRKRNRSLGERISTARTGEQCGVAISAPSGRTTAFRCAGRPYDPSDGSP